MNLDQIISELSFDPLFDSLGLENLDETQKTHFKKEILEILSNNLRIRLEDLVTPEDEAPLNAAENIDAVLEYFITVKKVSLEELVIEEGAKIREELITNMAYIQGALSKDIKE